VELKITVESEPSLPPPVEIPHFTLTQDVPFRYQVPMHQLEDWRQMAPVDLYNDHQELFVVDSQTGIVDYTPLNEHVGEWTVTFYMMAYDYIVEMARMDITVVNRNDRPVMDPMFGRIVTEGEPVWIDLRAHDPDLEPRLVSSGMRVDPEESLTFRSSLPHPQSFERTGQMTWVPTDADAKKGRVEVYFDVRDQSLQGDAINVTFHVVDVNHPPMMQIIGIVEGQKISPGKKITLRGSAYDVDTGDVDAFSYQWYAGTRPIGETQEIKWKVKGRGHVPIKLVVIDSEGQESQLVINITVVSVPICPSGYYYWLTIIVCIALPLVMVVAVSTVVFNHNKGKGHR
jgi:hypothetical protein